MIVFLYKNWEEFFPTHYITQSNDHICIANYMIKCKKHVEILNPFMPERNLGSRISFSIIPLHSLKFIKQTL